MAALEAVKWITGIGQPAVGEMVRMNTLDLSSIRINLEDTPLCPACAERRHTHAGIHQTAR
ncbi:molybdopterin biosynthesis protein MoeB [compost metagenome]